MSINMDNASKAHETLHANDECMKKRLNRYAKQRNVNDLIVAVQKLDKMKECIETMRKAVIAEYITMR